MSLSNIPHVICLVWLMQVSRQSFEWGANWIQIWYIITELNMASSSSGCTVRYGPWPPWWSFPRYSYQVLSFTMPLLSITLHLLRHYRATLIWVFPFCQEPSGFEKVSFLQGEFSSNLTKCPSHLILATFITLYISRSLYKLYSSSLYLILQTPFSHVGP
jgi:hypothetical protein